MSFITKKSEISVSVGFVILIIMGVVYLTTSTQITGMASSTEIVENIDSIYYEISENDSLDYTNITDKQIIIID